MSRKLRLGSLVVAWTVLVLSWAGAVGAGMRALWAYKTTPGAAGTAPPEWPPMSRLHRVPGLPTLVLFVHPHCPCTSASLAELERLMAHARDRVTAYALFYRPRQAQAGWERTASWSTAAAGIPGVTALRDDDGAEAALWGARTSGQAVLYDARGRLVFSGGITWARGHEGDNPGSDAIAALLRGGAAGRGPASTRVFGCPLRDDDDDDEENR